AEDGIRVFHVTGVQTCALPISAFRSAPRLPDRLVRLRPWLFALDHSRGRGRLLRIRLAAQARPSSRRRAGGRLIYGAVADYGAIPTFSATAAEGQQCRFSSSFCSSS